MGEEMTPQTNEATRVLLVDDFPAFRDSVRSLLEESPGFEVVGEAEDGLTATQLAETLRPDVVLMDVNISRLDGVTATRQIKALLPETSIIGISAIPTAYAREEMLKAGANGFVQKEHIPDQLLGAIDRAIRDRLLHL
jgi:NarL family two-component system response regulator LiaR